MIRLFIFLLAIVAFVIYFVLAFVRGIIRTLQKSSRSSSRFDRPQTPVKPKEDYKDVQDAKFTELSDKHKENSREPNT
jgi:hypothetical protein